MLFSSYDDVFYWLGSKTERPYPKGSPRATRIIRRGTDYGSPIAIKYHATDVVTYTPTGIQLNSDGFTTVTTKRCMNDALPDSLRVTQSHWEWFINDTPYHDGVQVTYDGHLIDSPKSDYGISSLAIKIYVHNYLELLYAGQIPAPSDGDCWFCSLHNLDNQTLGDASQDHSHLVEHIREGYYVPSLIVNVAREHGKINLPAWQHNALNPDHKLLYTTAMVDYLSKRLLNGR